MNNKDIPDGPIYSNFRPVCADQVLIVAGNYGNPLPPQTPLCPTGFVPVHNSNGDCECAQYVCDDSLVCTPPQEPIYIESGNCYFCGEPEEEVEDCEDFQCPPGYDPQLGQNNTCECVLNEDEEEECESTPDCGPGKRPNPENDCNCECINLTSCSQNEVWNEETCSCDEVPDPCAETNCPPGYDANPDNDCQCECIFINCGDGFVFNEDLCKCEPTSIDCSQYNECGPGQIAIPNDEGGCDCVNPNCSEVISCPDGQIPYFNEFGWCECIPDPDVGFTGNVPGCEVDEEEEEEDPDCVLRRNCAVINNPLDCNRNQQVFDKSGFNNLDVDIEPINENSVDLLETDPSLFFVKRDIEIKRSSKSRLSMYLKFETNLTPTVLRENRISFEKDNNNLILEKNEYLIIRDGYPKMSRVGFRILANGQTIYNLEQSFEGYVNVTVPANTSKVTLETYDSALPQLKTNSNIEEILGCATYYKKEDYSILFNDLKIIVPNAPSIPIGNNTRAGDFEFIEYESSASLSVDECSEDGGFYDVVIGQLKNGFPVDYFVVGDRYRKEVFSNLKPQDLNRNLVLKFKNPNFSKLDLMEKIELVFEIENIFTSDAEYFRSKDLNDYKIRSFYKGGGFDLLKISCHYNFNDFPEDVNSVSSIEGTLIDSIFIKGGLVIFDVTEAFKSSILASKTHTNIIIKYDIPNQSKDDKYKYITYNIGNKASNKPRIRFKNRNNLTEPYCPIVPEVDSENNNDVENGGGFIPGGSLGGTGGNNGGGIIPPIIGL